MIRYQNGNSTVELHHDGTRVIQYEDKLQLDYPLNIDIRVSTKCAFGMDPATGKAFCTFCHESARTDGTDCNYEKLQSKLIGLPKGIELAIGANQLSDGLNGFIFWCKQQGYVVNLTVNQGHVKRDETSLKYLIDMGMIKGLGISYRSSIKWNVPKSLLDYEHTVVHVIAGIDSVEEILALKEMGVKKVLVLGEKDFGFNSGKVDLTTREHKEWFWWVAKMFETFEITSFDNLALEQLKVKRFFNDENWEVFNQGEHSFYINAVDQYFAPSSRSKLSSSWDKFTVKEYFNLLEK